VELLAARDDTERILITDVRAPAVARPKTSYVEIDIRNPAMRALLEAEEPDALVHLAFILNPMHDEGTMYDIDVNGTQNVLDAAAAAGTGHLLVASST